MVEPPLWPKDRLKRTADVVGALDSPLRLQILLLLNTKPHVVHELVTELEKSQPLVSQHLRVLKNAGLVDATRTGREVAYSLAMPGIINIVESIAALSEGDWGDELAARRATRGPDLIDASRSTGSAAAHGPLPGHTPETDPGLLPDSPKPIQ